VRAKGASWKANLSGNRPVRIAVSEDGTPKPDNMISMPQFGQPRETTDELFATRTQSKCEYRAIAEMEGGFAKRIISFVRI